MDSEQTASLPPLQDHPPSAATRWAQWPARAVAWAQSPASRWVWMPLLAVGASRLVIAAVALVSLALVPDSTSPPPYHLRGQANPLVDVFGSRWDTGFYVSIAEEGYRYEGVPLPSVPFFPLLPLLMRLGALLTGDMVTAGILWSNLFLLAAAMLLYRLVEGEFGQSIADRSVWLMLIFPMAFFGSAIYTESLFLFCTIGALYAARRQRWGWAALLGMAAASTRLVGVVMAPVLLAEWWMQQGMARPAPRLTAAASQPASQGSGLPQTCAKTGHNKKPNHPPSQSSHNQFGVRPRGGGRWRGLVAAALVPLGTLAYMVYLQLTFGDPLAFVHGTAAWDRVPRPLPELVGQLLQTPAGGWMQAVAAGAFPWNDWIDLLAAAGFLVMGTVLLAQNRWGEGLLVVLGALIPLYSGLLMSQRRYMWVLFPVFILLARWSEGRPWLERIITLSFGAGLALSVALFANGYWVA